MTTRLPLHELEWSLKLRNKKLLHLRLELISGGVCVCEKVKTKLLR